MERIFIKKHSCVYKIRSGIYQSLLTGLDCIIMKGEHFEALCDLELDRPIFNNKK